MDLTVTEQLAAFIDTLKQKGVRSYKGEVPVQWKDGPVTSADRFPIEIVFDRPARHSPETD